MIGDTSNYNQLNFVSQTEMNQGTVLVFVHNFLLLLVEVPVHHVILSSLQFSSLAENLNI